MCPAGLASIPKEQALSVRTFNQGEFEALRAEITTAFASTGIDLGVVDLQAFETWLKGIDVEKWALQLARQPMPDPSEGLSRSQRNIYRTRIITQFFPNFFHVLMGTMALFEAVRPPDTLYEYGVVIQIYRHIFDMLRKLLATCHHLTKSALKTTLWSGLIFGGGVGGFYLYLRWTDGCPTKIEHCKVLDIPKLEGDDEAKKYRRVIFVGPPGVGKSLRLKELASKIADKRIFQIENDKLFRVSSPGENAAQKLERIFKHACGWEDTIGFMWDEMGEAHKSDATSIANCLKPFSDDSKTFFWGAMTDKEWEKFKAEALPLASRFHVIHLAPTSDAKTEQIVQQAFEKNAPHMPISESTRKYIVQVTNQKRKDYFQPRQALMLVDRIVEDWAHLTETVPQPLKEKRQELEALKRAAPVWNVGSEKYAQHKDKEEKLEAEIAALETSFRPQHKDLIALDALLKIENAWKIRMIQSAHTQMSPLKLAFYQYFVIEKIAAQINAKIATLAPTLFNFDSAYIDGIYK